MIRYMCHYLLLVCSMGYIPKHTLQHCVVYALRLHVIACTYDPVHLPLPLISLFDGVYLQACFATLCCVCFTFACHCVYMHASRFMPSSLQCRFTVCATIALSKVLYFDINICYCITLAAYYSGATRKKTFLYIA